MLDGEICQIYQCKVLRNIVWDHCMQSDLLRVPFLLCCIIKLCSSLRIIPDKDDILNTAVLLQKTTIYINGFTWSDLQC